MSPLRLSVLISASLLALAMTAGIVRAATDAPVTARSRSKKNGDVARLAGFALHLSQDAQALQRSSVKRRAKLYGRSDPQVRMGRRRLHRIRHKVAYFRRVKRRSEGREKAPS